MRCTAKKLIPVILLAGSAATWPAAAADEERTARAQAVLDDLLRTTCRVGASGEIVGQLRQYQDLLTPMLVDLLEDGPAPETIAWARRSSQHEWIRREAFLSSEPAVWLGHEERRIAESQTRQDYVQRGVERFLGGYRERVVNGLRTIGTPEALDALTRLGDEPQDLEDVGSGYHAPRRSTGSPRSGTEDGRRQDPARRSRERPR